MTLARRAVFDEVLPSNLFENLSAEAANCVDGETGFDGFADGDVWQHLEPHVTAVLGPVRVNAAFFVETVPSGSGSRPHYDHGKHSAVLHLNTKWDLAWGGDFFFLKDHQTIDVPVEFRPNRLVVWDCNQLHMHRPPTGTCSEKNRLVLVMRFDDDVHMD